MKAIVYTENGPSSVLRLERRDIPTPAAGEVLVRIVVSGVNPTDTKSRAGSGPRPTALQVPGQDGSGVVESVGGGVRGFAPGDRVWVWDAAFARPNGTSQEYLVLPARQVVALPDSATFDEGASLGIPALTAHRALTTHDGGPDRLAPGVLAGETVLVAGGAGAVGHAAIQLAAWAGATVITTVSNAAKAALVTAAGAHHVINYREEDLVARVKEIAPDGVSRIVEVNPTANIEADLAMVEIGGAINVYATDDDPEVSVPIRVAMSKNVRLQFLLTYTTTRSQKADAVAAVSAALADGALKVGESAGLPLTRFPLDDTAGAHDAVENKAVGKVLIDVTPA